MNQDQSTIPTRPLFVLTAQLAAPQMETRTPRGDRRIVPVIGGTVRGDRINGKILPIGGHDWALTRPDGTLELDVRLVLETNDGAEVLITYRGYRRQRDDGLYFRTAVAFETGDQRYAWLNSILAVGIGTRPPDGPRYEVHEIL